MHRLEHPIHHGRGKARGPQPPLNPVPVRGPLGLHLVRRGCLHEGCIDAGRLGPSKAIWVNCPKSEDLHLGVPHLHQGRVQPGSMGLAKDIVFNHRNKPEGQMSSRHTSPGNLPTNLLGWRICPLLKTQEVPRPPSNAAPARPASYTGPSTGMIPAKLVALAATA
jgi:hypothetical protein